MQIKRGIRTHVTVEEDALKDFGDKGIRARTKSLTLFPSLLGYP